MGERGRLCNRKRKESKEKDVSKKERGKRVREKERGREQERKTEV